MSDENGEATGRPEDPAEAEPEAPAEGAGEAAAQEQPDLADALEPPPDEGVAAAFHKRAVLAEDRLAEVLAAYRQLKTDTEGHRERVARNLERRYGDRRDRLLVKFIDILDNLDRALEAAEASSAGQALIDGLILVRTQLLQTLQDEGLERIPVLGLPYDPHHAEAVATQPVEDPDQHHLVVKELLRGYRLNGRVARHSRVLVGVYGEAEAQAAAQPPEPDEQIGVEEEAPAIAAAEEQGPSLEEIVARAETQEALFPGAFEDDGDP